MIPVNVILSVGLVKLELSSDCNLKVIVGVDEPFEQEPKSRSTTPPEQPQSTVSLASTDSQS